MDVMKARTRGTRKGAARIRRLMMLYESARDIVQGFGREETHTPADTIAPRYKNEGME